jgi:ABC-type nitrate/sulfonate/bicarbonate transport system ATPase subunit
MQQWLLRIWEEHRKTILFVTHDVDEALYLSDRVYAMSKRPGRITQILDVGIPRPRPYDVITSDPFIEMKQVLLEQLRLAHGSGKAA